MGWKKGLFIILAALWAAVLLYNFGFSRKGLSGKAKAERAAAEEGFPALRLDLLERPRPGYREIRKDIFTPIGAPVLFPRALNPLFAPPVPPTSPPPPPPPSALMSFAGELRFIGFVEKGKGRTVFLMRGPDVFLVRKSDLVDGRFRASEITDTELILKDEGTEEEARISLVK